MNCTYPPELSELQLLMAADGEADSAVERHLAGCAYCRQRSTDLARQQEALKQRLWRATCPSALALGEFRMGLCTPAEAAAMARHLAECPHCTAELAELDRFLAEPAPEPSPSALEVVKQRVQVWVASLISGAQRLSLPSAPALASVRGANDEPLIYVAGDLQLTLQAEPAGAASDPQSRLLIGMVLGLAHPELATVHLWRGDRPWGQQPVDDLGNFTIGGLVPGRYELILSAPDVEVHVQELTIA